MTAISINIPPETHRMIDRRIHRLSSNLVSVLVALVCSVQDWSFGAGDRNSSTWPSQQSMYLVWPFLASHMLSTAHTSICIVGLERWYCVLGTDSSGAFFVSSGLVWFVSFVLFQPTCITHLISPACWMQIYVRFFRVCSLFSVWWVSMFLSAACVSFACGFCAPFVCLCCEV